MSSENPIPLPEYAPSPRPSTPSSSPSCPLAHSPVLCSPSPLSTSSIVVVRHPRRSHLRCWCCHASHCCRSPSVHHWSYLCRLGCRNGFHVDSRVSIRVFSQVDSVSFPSFWTVTPVIAPRLLTCAIIKQRCRRLRLLMGDHYWPPYNLLRILTLSPVRSSHSTFVPRLCPFLSPLTGSGTSVSITLSGTLSTRSLVLLVWRSRCSSSGDPQYAGCFLFTYFCEIGRAHV